MIERRDSHACPSETGCLNRKTGFQGRDKRRSEIPKARETGICMSSGGRRLIRPLSEELFAEPTAGDRCRLYPPGFVNLASRGHERSAGD